MLKIELNNVYHGLNKNDLLEVYQSIIGEGDDYNRSGDHPEDGPGYLGVLYGLEMELCV